jgi:hypothetical protein
MTTRLAPALLLAFMALSASPAFAGSLPDGTRIPVRLVTFISSEDSRNGDRIEFVVTSNIVVDGRVVIARGARVMGIVVQARRAKWGFSSNRHARLAFVFTYTTACNGDLVRLRGPASRRADDRVVVDRERFHHDFQWAGGADTFEAYVDGNH